jgi:exosortase
LSEGSLTRRSDPGSLLRSPELWVGLGALVVGCLVYAPAFFPESTRSLTTESEEFFFQPSGAASAPVLVLSLWLFYRRIHLRDVLCGVGAPIAAAAALATALLLYGWGTYTSAPDLQLLSLIFVLGGAVLLLGGWAGLRAYWLPILFLGFALPISSVLIAATIFPIQLVTADLAGAMLHAMGLEVVVSGDQILRPDASFVVVESCSGVRTMLTLGMLCVLLIDLFERRGWHAAILFALAPIVAFLTNGVRVVTLVLNPHSSLHSVHNLQGIVMLLIGLVVLYLIDGRLERWLASGEPTDAPADYGTQRAEVSSAAGRALRLGAVVLVLVAMLALDDALPRWSLASHLEERPEALLTRVFGEETLPPLPLDYRFRGSVGYLAEARHRIAVDGTVVEVFLGVGHEQRRELSILSKRLAWPASGYEPVEETWIELPGTSARVRRMILRRGGQALLSYSWIERRHGLAVEWFRQAAALDHSPFVRPAHMLALRFATPILPGDAGLADAERRLLGAWSRLAPDLAGYASTRGGLEQ